MGCLFCNRQAGLGRAIGSCLLERPPLALEAYLGSNQKTTWGGGYLGSMSHFSEELRILPFPLLMAGLSA